MSNELEGTSKLVDEIINYRARNKLTQSQFADMCGLSTTTILEIETGIRKTPTKRTVKIIENKIKGD